MQNDDYSCMSCRRFELVDTQKRFLISRPGAGLDEFEVLINGIGWIELNGLRDPWLIKWLAKQANGNVISAKEISVQGNGSKGTKRIWEFSKTERYFGVTQYVNILSRTELDELEELVTR